jgi:hypothetical protein
MSAVPAANGLAALERDVLVAITAFVVDGAGVCVDGRGVLRAGGGIGVVLLGRHFGRGIWGLSDVGRFVRARFSGGVGGVEMWWARLF